MGRRKQPLGQHFLHDPAVIQRIVAAISPSAGDTVVEIGPGTGALTGPLLSILETLHVVELDTRLADALPARLPDASGLVVHRGSALDFDLSSQGFEGPVRLVGNLPYNISTPLLFHFLDQAARVTDMHFMLQKEVVQRMAADPGSKRYGRLSVTCQLRAQVRPLFDVGPGAFKPPPDVRSTVVRLTPRRDWAGSLIDERHLDELLIRLFSMRRKTLANGVRPWLTADDLLTLGIDPKARPETLAVEQFVAISNYAAGRPQRGLL